MAGETQSARLWVEYSKTILERISDHQKQIEELRVGFTKFLTGDFSTHRSDVRFAQKGIDDIKEIVREIKEDAKEKEERDRKEKEEEQERKERERDKNEKHWYDNYTLWIAVCALINGIVMTVAVIRHW